MVNKLLTFAAFVFLTTSAQAQVTAKVSQTEVYDDESLLLTVQVSPVNELNPQDISALESLFTIEQQARQESRQNINGRSSSQVDFQFRIRPKTTGTLGIPNFRVNGEQSQPIFITVLDSGQRKDSLSDDAVIFEATVSNAAPYIDQAITLNLELAYKIQFRNGGIADIPLDDFDTVVLNENQTTKMINGQSYNVYQRSYQLTPKKAGIYSLPKLRFTAEYPNQQQGRFVRFSRTAEVEPIQVRGIPDSYPAGAFWLPLTSLTINDNLKNQQSTQQNEHINWQITLLADGLPANRLPDVLKNIEQTLGNDIKLYRNAPSITDNRRVESAALSFLRPGNYSLPEITVPWWNIKTDRLETATIPARSFSVTAAAPNLSPNASSIALPNGTLTDTVGNADTLTQVSIPESKGWKIAAFVSTIGWIMTTIVALWFWRFKTTLPTEPATQATPTRKPVQINSERDCYQAYLAILREHRLSANQLTHYLDASEIDQLQRLEAFLYRNADVSIDLNALKKIVAKLKQEVTQKSQKQTTNAFKLYREA